MAAKQVQLHWEPETKFTVRNKNNVEVRINQPNAVSASELLPMALIGCSSYDVVEILEKQRQALTRLNVTADSVQDEDPPWRFRKIDIHFQVIGRGLDVEKVHKAILLSEEKYCSVYVTLRDAIEITHVVEVLEG